MIDELDEILQIQNGTLHDGSSRWILNEFASSILRSIPFSRVFRATNLLADSRFWRRARWRFSRSNSETESPNRVEISSFVKDEEATRRDREYDETQGERRRRRSSSSSTLDRKIRNRSNLAS